MESNHVQSPDIVAAKEEVERAKQELASRLRTASESGKQMLDRTIERTVENTKPLVIAAAALGAGALVLGLAKLARPRRSRGLAAWAPPTQPSFVGTLFRSVLASAAASLTSVMMQRLQRALDPTLQGARALPGTGVQPTRGPGSFGHP